MINLMYPENPLFISSYELDTNKSLLVFQIYDMSWGDSLGQGFFKIIFAFPSPGDIWQYLETVDTTQWG